MAKLYYGASYGTITVREDDDPVAGEIEVTAEQAIAVMASQVAAQLGNISESLDEISRSMPRK